MVPRAAIGGLLCVAIVAGTASDRARVDPPLTLGGYRVIAADFHAHPAIAGGAALAPWDLVLEAQRQGLDALAITPHNKVFPAQAGVWFSRLIGGPTVLVGEEVRAARFHIIGVGIARTVSPHQTAAAAIADIHSQGGVAIAAHPIAEYWPAYDAAAMAMLDGSEVMHPAAYSKNAASEFDAFYGRRLMAAIGSSDYHGIGRLGMCRTFVFAADASAPAILDALRARRTVVYGAGGRAYGDAALVRLAEEDGRLRARAADRVDSGPLVWISRVAAIVGLAGLALLSSG
jgi:predicted metal-dependent phosphoesterase TrpH